MQAKQTHSIGGMNHQANHAPSRRLGYAQLTCASAEKNEMKNQQTLLGDDDIPENISLIDALSESLGKPLILPIGFQSPILNRTNINSIRPSTVSGATKESSRGIL